MKILRERNSERMRRREKGQSGSEGVHWPERGERALKSWADTKLRPGMFGSGLRQAF